MDIPASHGEGRSWGGAEIGGTTDKTVKKPTDARRQSSTRGSATTTKRGVVVDLAVVIEIHFLHAHGH